MSELDASGNIIIDDGAAIEAELYPIFATGQEISQADMRLFIDKAVDQADAIIDLQPIRLVADIIASTADEIHVAPGTYAFATDVTIVPRLVFEPGALLRPADGVRVTLSAGYEAHATQHVFDISLGGEVFSTDRGTISSQYHWGALNDGSYDIITGIFTGTDNTRAIQALIDNHLYFNGSYEARLAPGVHRVTSPLHIGYGDSFRSAILTGPENTNKHDFDAKFKGAALLCETWENAIEVAGGRGSGIANLYICGPWFSYLYMNRLGFAKYLNNPSAEEVYDSLDPANWVPPDAPANVQHRYKYSCGIHFDPRTGAKSAVYYSDVTYPADLPGADYATSPYGLNYQYGKRPSSLLHVMNCTIKGFGCGIALQGSQAGDNCDYLKIEDCNLGPLFLGIASGHTQSRLNSINRTVLGQAFYGVSTSAIGQQLGKPQHEFTSCEFSSVVYLGDVKNMDYGDGLIFDGCYGENIYSLGNFYSSALGGVAMFRKCLFSFEHVDRPVPKYMIETKSARVAFQDCGFGGCGGAFVINGYPAYTQWSSTLTTTNSNCWTGGTYASSRAKARAFNTTLGIMFGSYANGQQGGWHGHGSFSPYDMTGAFGIQSPSQFGYGPKARSRYDSVIPFCAQTVTGWTNPGEPIQVNLGNPGKVDNSSGAISSGTHTGKQLTLGFSTTYTLGQRQNYGMSAGSLCLHYNTGTLFVITSSTSNSVVMEQVNNYDSDTDTYTQVVAYTDGNFYFIPTGFYVPDSELEMSWTSGSPLATYARADTSTAFKDQMPVGACKALTLQSTPYAPISETNSAVTSAYAAGTVAFEGNARLTVSGRSGLWIVPEAEAVEDTTPTILKISGGSAWNGGFSSTTGASTGEDFEVGYTAGSQIYMIAGFSTTNTGTSDTTVKFGIGIWFSGGLGQLHIYEDGVQKYATGVVTEGDTLSVRRTGSTVTYRHNGNLVYTSLTASTGNLVVDGSIYSEGARIVDIYMKVNGVTAAITINDLVNCVAI